MKKKCLACLLWLVVAISVHGQDGFTSQVEGMWRAGDHAGVLAIAQQRLATDPNDLPGLLLKFDYEVEYLQLDEATNTATEILRVAPQIGTERFSEVRDYVTLNAQTLIEVVTNYPPAEYARDLARVGTITNKFLSYKYAIQALEEDGYFSSNAPAGPSAP